MGTAENHRSGSEPVTRLPAGNVGYELDTGLNVPCGQKLRMGSIRRIPF